MKTRFKLITWNIEEECIFSREFKSENRAIETAQALSNRKTYPHDVIRILKTKKNRTQMEISCLEYR